MQVISPDAPIRASEPLPPKNAPEHSPIADSSRLTGMWSNRASASNSSISAAIQPSGRLATSSIPDCAACSAMAAATSRLGPAMPGSYRSATPARWRRYCHARLTDISLVKVAAQCSISASDK